MGCMDKIKVRRDSSGKNVFIVFDPRDMCKDCVDIIMITIGKKRIFKWNKAPCTYCGREATKKCEGISVKKDSNHKTTWFLPWYICDECVGKIGEKHLIIK